LCEPEREGDVSIATSDLYHCRTWFFMSNTWSQGSILELMN